MPHAIEETGINCLIDHLRKAGHTVKRRHGTFDLEVDGQLAEVKAKDKVFGKIDFISLTDKQYQAAQTQDFEAYIVCGAQGVTPEFYQVRAQALLAKKARIVTSYEYDLSSLRDIVEPI